ncbi:MAG: BON domain-containing protein [Planctomycetales bacterium]
MRIADAIPPSLSRTENATAFWLTIEAHEGRVTLSGSVARDADRVRLAEIATRVPGAASVENRIEVGMPSSTYLDAEYSGESVADVMTAKEVIRALGKARVVAWNNIEIRPEFLRPFDRLLDPLYMIVERAAEAEAGAGTVATLAYGGLAVLVVESHQRFAWAVADGLGPMVGWHPEREEFPGSIFIGSDFLGPDFEHFAGAGFEGLHGDGVEVELMSVETIAAPPRPVIRVDVRDGVATLTGSAESDALRVRAGRVAAEVPGVLRVENRLQVQSQAEYEERLQREIMKHLRMDELPRAPRADAGIQPSGSRIGR